MPFTRQQALKIFATLLLVAFAALLWRTGFSSKAKNGDEASDFDKGEEVYASHDCTDCHLAAHVLRAKRAKGEAGLIRVRKDEIALIGFLQSDKRHETYLLISESDRRSLIEYLKKQ